MIAIRHRTRERTRGGWFVTVATIIVAAAGCKSHKTPAAAAGETTTTVAAAITTPTLQALYKNGDAAAPNDNQLKPFFKIKNAGTTSIALSTLTVRYWYTIESGSPEQVWVDYAQVGNANVHGNVVRLPTPATGADRYLEVSFASAAGSLGAGVTSGEIQMRVNKADWTVYDETNDYSYQNVTSYVTAPKVTLYWNGMLVWGTEPAAVRNCDAGVRTRILYVAGDRTTPNDNQIKPHIQLVNTGFTDIPLSEVKIRYWFTSDTTSPEQAWIDYAQLGGSKITTVFVSPPVAVANADRYLEVGFTASAGTLLAGASTGEIQLRFNKTDWSNYNEANDASYDGTRTDYQPSMQLTAYRNGLLLWGQEPTPGASIAGQSVFVQGTLVRAADGTITKTVGSQTFTSPVPFTFPDTMPVSEGNLGNQAVSLVLSTSAGTINCSYSGGSSVASPTTDQDVAFGRVALFRDCDQACPAIGDSLFITGITLTVLGADPTQSRTTVTLNRPSSNEPEARPTPIADNDPTFLPQGDPKPTFDPTSTGERHPGSPDHPHVVASDIPGTFTTNPIAVGHVDTVDPDVIISQ